MVKELKERPSNGTPRVYVTIHKGIGGWNSSVWRWAGDDPDGFPGYEPSETGFTNTSLGTGKRDDAIRDARHWAECEDLPLWLSPNAPLERSPSRYGAECPACGRDPDGIEWAEHNALQQAMIANKRKGK